MRGVTTLEKLKKSKLAFAAVWRYVRAHPGTTRLQMCEGLGIRETTLDARLNTLVRQGWILSEKLPGTKSSLYTAQTTGLEKKKPANLGKSLNRRRLNTLVTLSKVARKTALPLPMSRALSEIEKELRLIRDSL